MKEGLLCFLLITCILTGYALGQGKDIIIKLNVTGNDRIERGVITNAIKSKEKDVYDPEKIREDMKNVYKTGFFSDVQVDVNETPGEGLLPSSSSKGRP